MRPLIIRWLYFRGDHNIIFNCISWMFHIQKKKKNIMTNVHNNSQAQQHELSSSINPFLQVTDCSPGGSVASCVSRKLVPGTKPQDAKVSVSGNENRQPKRPGWKTVSPGWRCMISFLHISSYKCNNKHHQQLRKLSRVTYFLI